MVALAQKVKGPGRIYLTGGATSVLHDWRTATIDIDLKPDPEPDGFFEALPSLKDALDINIKLASPDQFIPLVPGWRERSLFIACEGPIEFYHYDPYSQALAKLQRCHARDLHDVKCMVRAGLVNPERLRELFDAIAPQLLRYPAIDAESFRISVTEFCRSYSHESGGK